jgi:cobalamin reductase
MLKQNRKDLLNQIRIQGIAGAGGAGFPTHVKLNCQADTVIANGAECEPLLHKDKELMVHHPQVILTGLKTAMTITGAREGVIGIKKKAVQAIEYLAEQISEPVRIHLLDDTYPAGDEFVLTYEVTGKVPPPGGLPLDVGVVTQNVETLYWIGKTSPVTHKWVTVAGSVPSPKTVIVPVGTRVKDVLPATGWQSTSNTEVLAGGVMMGRLVSDLDEPVTKVMGGLIVLPRDHPLIQRYKQPDRAVSSIARSACDQCNFCTQLCPRNLLGHPVEPHISMRHITMAPPEVPPPAGSLYCCGCNLCTFWSCPENLDPGRITFAYRASLQMGPEMKPLPGLPPHPLYPYRKPALSVLKRRLGLAEFDDNAPFTGEILAPSVVTIPLKQHMGVPAVSQVKPGDWVREGDVIADVPDGQLGVPVHASINGQVESIDEIITIGGETP